MSRLLTAIRRAQKHRTAAYAEYLAAIQAAYPEHTLDEIGKAAGITRQGARYLLNPDRATTRESRKP